MCVRIECIYVNIWARSEGLQVNTRVRIECQLVCAYRVHLRQHLGA